LEFQVLSKQNYHFFEMSFVKFDFVVLMVLSLKIESQLFELKRGQVLVMFLRLSYLPALIQTIVKLGLRF